MLFAAATATVSVMAGWWLIPVLAAVWVRVLPRTTASALELALGAALGWAGMLAWGATQAPLGNVARRVGGVFHMPAWVFVLTTLGFAAALAVLAAASARRPPQG
jgi:hypothetical protein